jgi:hypothetical protein
VAARGLGIPAAEIEHAASQVWRLPAPGKLPLRTAVRCVGRALEFGLGRQSRAAPAREGVRFRPADVDRPRSWQRQHLEHPAPLPFAAELRPESRVPHAFAPDPRPVVGTPPARLAIPARLDELEVRGIRRVVPLDGERRHVGLECRPLVVPGERDLARVDAEARASRRDGDPLLRRRSSTRQRRVGRRPVFLAHREPVAHVAQRLLVHGLVLQDRVHGLGAFQQRMTRPFEIRALQRGDDAAIGLVGELPYFVT